MVLIIDQETFDKAQAVLEKRHICCNIKSSTCNRYPFSGVILCGICGKKYKRKVIAGKAVWKCTTFLKEGKTACHSKQIPEPMLYAISAEVLGLNEFDADSFEKELAEILATEFNKLIFVFQDGHTTEKVWQYRSRSEIWTDEMRQAARAKAGKGQ